MNAESSIGHLSVNKSVVLQHIGPTEHGFAAYNVRCGTLGNPAYLDTQAMTNEPENVTRLLNAASNDEAGAWTRLFSILYDQLQQMATKLLHKERPNHTWRRTDLVHEAFIRLVGEDNIRWTGRKQFFAAAARAMRCLLVDYARRRNAAKRGGEDKPLSLDEEHDVAGESAVPDGLAVDIEALDVALARIETDPRHRDKCKLVELRFFAGLSMEQTAQVLGRSLASVKRDWAFIKARIKHEMSKEGRP